MALQSSKNKIGGGLDETGGVSAIVLSDSDEEDHCRVVGKLKGASFKEPGGLRADVGGSLRNTENHDKSKGSVQVFVPIVMLQDNSNVPLLRARQQLVKQHQGL